MGSSLHNHNSEATLKEEAGIVFVEEETVAGHWWATKLAKELEAEHAVESHESAATSAWRPSNLLRKPTSPPRRASGRRSMEGSNDDDENHIIDVGTKAAVTAAAVIMSGHRPVGRPKRCALGDSSSSSKVRKTDDLINAVQRASQAAGKAAHICEQARIAFEAEKNNLEAALEDIERTP